MKLDRKPTLDAFRKRDDLAGKCSKVLQRTRVDVFLERRQIVRVDVNPDFVKDVWVEKVVGRLGEYRN